MLHSAWMSMRLCPVQLALRRVPNRSHQVQTLMRRCYASSASQPSKISWRNALAVSAIATGVATILIATRPRVELAPAQTSVVSTSKKSEPKLISLDELRKHNTKESCWILVRDKVYDVTDFLYQHPGGAAIIIANSGRDVTGLYERTHPPGLMETLLKPEQYLGAVDINTLKIKEAIMTEDGMLIEEARKWIPPIDALVDFDDIEEVARHVLSKVAWSYYASSADGGHAFKENLDAFSRYWFRPRVLRKVQEVDMSTKILGMPTSLPVFACPAGLAKLGHPIGEINITRGAYTKGFIQAVPLWGSCTPDDVAVAKRPEQNVIMQLYVNRDHSVTEATLKKISELGYKAIMVTVDTPVSGKRTKDIKARSGPLIRNPDQNDGSRPIRSGIAGTSAHLLDANLNWDDLAWIASISKLPVIVKGVQSVEDVELAEKYGCAGVLLSNHGGRQLDYAPASIDILYELRQRRPDILDNKKMEIYCDGGYRRGTDVLKALCLGATAVGMGRPFLYANAGYGEDGVVKLVEILQDEIATGMRFLGVTKIEELGPHLLRRVDHISA